jgi:hypothetical protein
MSAHLNDNGIWTPEFLEIQNVLDLLGIYEEEISDVKMRQVIIDRPRMLMQQSNMVEISAKRDSSPKKAGVTR